MKYATPFILLAFTSPTGAAAAMLPQFKVESACKMQSDASDDEGAFRRECMENEGLARSLIQSEIDSKSESEVADCVKSITNGQPGSYLALLGCLKLKEGPQAASVEKKDTPPLSAGSPHLKSSQATAGPQFTRDLEIGASDPEVAQLQKFLNSRGFQIASGGPGSPGHESEKFGRSTRTALTKFQEAHRGEIGMSTPTGQFDALTRDYVNKLAESK